VHAFNARLLEKLEARISSWSVDKPLADIFLANLVLTSSLSLLATCSVDDTRI
jgi:hypothetical protein